MAKVLNDNAIDQAFEYVKSNVNELVLLNADPGTSYTQAHSAFALGRIAVTSDDFTIANGDTSGRKITVSAQSSIGVDTTGNCNHVACNNTTANSTEVVIVTEVTSQSLTAGNAASTNAFDDEIEDPA